MSVFKDAPMTRLNAEETQAFSKVIINALDQGPEGTTVEWKAPKTQFTSKITPGKSTSEGKRQCREVVIESEAKDRFQRGTYSFCKAASGQWQFAVPDSKPAKKK
jgi:surface antigen